MRHSTQPDVVRGYVACTLLTDIVWWASLAYCLGEKGLNDRQNWPTALWGQWIGPACTFSIKAAYLTGLLGKDRLPAMKTE